MGKRRKVNMEYKENPADNIFTAFMLILLLAPMVFGGYAGWGDGGTLRTHVIGAVIWGILGLGVGIFLCVMATVIVSPEVEIEEKCKIDGSNYHLEVVGRDGDIYRCKFGHYLSV